MAKNAEKLTVDPIRPVDFGLIIHKVRQFSANVPGHLKTADLENPSLWANVAGQVEMGSEIRCLADDMSFVAYGVCTFAQGSTVKIKITSSHKLDQVDHEALNDAASDYQAKLRGPKKWCIVQTSTGEVIKADIPTQLEAVRELEDYKRALRS